MFAYTEHLISDYVNSIIFDRITKHEKAFDFIESIIKKFAVGDELFWSHYRRDGFNLSKETMDKYSVEIPEFFSAYGEYRCVNSFNLKNYKFGDGLTVCRCPNDNNTYRMICKIFQYFLETTVFCSDCDWDSFIEYNKDYMCHSAEDYIINGFAKILFLYSDSGDFSIIFDLREYDTADICKQIDSLIREIA